MMQFFQRFVIIFFLTFNFLVGQSSSKTYRLFSDWQRSEAKGVQINSLGSISLAPAIQRTTQIPDGIIWSLVPDGPNSAFVSAGNEGKLYRLRRGQLQPWTQLKNGNIFAMAKMGDDILVAPTGERRLLRITPTGEAKFFASIDASVVWSLQVEGTQVLVAGGSDKGAILTLAREGSSRKLMELPQEIAFTAMVGDTQGNLILGTHGSGLVIKYNRTTDRFENLIDSGGSEIRSLAVWKNNIFAAVNYEPIIKSDKESAETSLPQDSYFPRSGRPIVKSKLLVLDRESRESRVIWESSQSHIFALYSWNNNLLLGTGDRSRIFSFSMSDPSLTFSLLGELNCAQATSFASYDNELYAVGSNPGEIYTFSSNQSLTGYLESEVIEAANPTRWGRSFFKSATPQGTSASIQFRNGSTRSPDETWTSWSPSLKSGEKPVLPLSTFLQFRLKLQSQVGALTPSVGEVKISWASNENVFRLSDVQVLAPGKYLDPEFVNQDVALKSFTDPKEGLDVVENDASSETYSHQKNIQGFVFQVEVMNRGSGLTIQLLGPDDQIYLLEKRWNARMYAFDTLPWSEGVYRLSVGSSDGELPRVTPWAPIVSNSFVIDHTPPSFSTPSFSLENNQLNARFITIDTLSPIGKVLLSMDGLQWMDLRPDDQIYDQLREEFILTGLLVDPTLTHVYLKAIDDHSNQRIQKITVTPSKAK